MTPTRVPVSPKASLFGSNSLYAVLHELAGRAGAGSRKRPAEFYVSELRASLGFSRRQLELDVKKLRDLGVVTVEERRGRRTPIRIVDSDLTTTLLSLVRLLDDSAGD